MSHLPDSVPWRTVETTHPDDHRLMVLPMTEDRIAIQVDDEDQSVCVVVKLADLLALLRQIDGPDWVSPAVVEASRRLGVDPDVMHGLTPTRAEAAALDPLSGAL